MFIFVLKINAFSIPIQLEIQWNIILLKCSKQWMGIVQQIFGSTYNSLNVMACDKSFYIVHKFKSYFLDDKYMFHNNSITNLIVYYLI